VKLDGAHARDPFEAWLHDIVHLARDHSDRKRSAHREQQDGSIVTATVRDHRRRDRRWQRRLNFRERVSHIVRDPIDRRTRRELEEDRHVKTSVAVLADCKEEERMREVFDEHRPAIVFHAAAYKHVGLMEENPVEAIRNNALATRVVARVAGQTGVGTFVLISTDKAVSPATVMGASKALAEWALEAAGARHPQTRYASVRFGNVLGSSGSVVPIFRRQIAAGGPVTVTDPRMTRYFMTIPEAVQLVIRSASLGKGGEVFVLEMGDPVAIVDLARDMIRLSGLEPDRDIAIETVGRRPGEKLHEELFNPYERAQPTPADKILLAERESLDPAWAEAAFDRIGLLVLEGDAKGLAAAVAELSAERSAAALRTAP